MDLLRRQSQSDHNTEDIIELSYDLQSGAYIKALDKPENRRTKLRFTAELAEVMDSFGQIDSLLDAGMGDGTTLWGLISQMKSLPGQTAGFDLSWSRVACARRWLKASLPEMSWTGVSASLSEIPCADSSFDVVYTCHALEPNRGRERELLSELIRVTRRKLVLLEPAYEFASKPIRVRMDKLGYCRGLADTAEQLGMTVRLHEMFTSNRNEMNPTAILVLEKPQDSEAGVESEPWVCPAYHKPLIKLHDCWYSRESMRAYPLLDGIPCLRTRYGIVASKLLDGNPALV